MRQPVALVLPFSSKFYFCGQVNGHVRTSTMSLWRSTFLFQVEAIASAPSGQICRLGALQAGQS
uniref:Uncharacterized protein n=1 Tax=Arion vulgaris TaxID=1028688 RepID=A0A0B6YHA2_9EUPU